MGVLHDDKKLRASTVRVLGASHGDHTTDVRTVVEFGFNLIARATCAISGLVFLVFGVRIAPLNHEVWDDTMKDGLVIKPGLCELDKIFHVLRRFIRKEADLDAAEFRVNNGPGFLPTGCLSFHACAPSGNENGSKYNDPDEYPTNKHRHTFLSLAPCPG